MIITIDGPSGSGKSTVAKELAKKTGYIFFDTGAMYRCLTYALLIENINFKDEKALQEFLNHFSFDITTENNEKKYYYKNQDITHSIRGKKVTSMVATIAAIPSVRTSLVKIQRNVVKEGVNAIFEGRDLGSTVFPEAEIKIYLTADPEVRAKRRLAEIQAKYGDKSKHITQEDILEEVIQRDKEDMERQHSPLKCPEDAYVIDVSNKSIQEVLSEIMQKRTYLL